MVVTLSGSEYKRAIVEAFDTTTQKYMVTLDGTDSIITVTADSCQFASAPKALPPLATPQEVPLLGAMSRFLEERFSPKDTSASHRQLVPVPKRIVETADMAAISENSVDTSASGKTAKSIDPMAA